MEKKSFIVCSLIFLFIAPISFAEFSDYRVEHITNETPKQFRFYYKDHHFLTIIDDNATFNIRPHPGVDENGWGSSFYLQPFLPNAMLNYTIIENITVYINKIEIIAKGNVSRGQSSAYGAWNASINFTYDQNAKIINGYGTYNIKLISPLSASTGDLNLYKIASNYLDDVPLLDGTINDTGDMQYALVYLNTSNFSWIPTLQPSHFPQDRTDKIDIDVIGQRNIVDSAAQGYAAIDPAYKPSLKINMTSKQKSIPMIFGGIYDTANNNNKKFWVDNVGITPLILKESSSTVFSFTILFNSITLEGDGNDLDYDGYNSTNDCNDSNISINPAANEICDGVDNNCNNLIDEVCNNSFSILLVPGWNLISLPFNPANKSVKSIFSSINNNYSSVMAYNSSDFGDEWKSYDPARPEFLNTLKEVGNTMGIWIKMKNFSMFRTNGSTTNPRFILRLGWNLISYPSIKGQSVSDALQNVSGQYSSVFGYNASDLGNEWKSYDPNRPDFLNTLKNFTPGFGYWVQAKNDTNWTYINKYRKI